MKSKRKNSEAFTLIELLVVVAIIGILSAMIFVSMTSAQATARDGRRQSELSQTKKALQSYYLQNGGYPATGADGISLEADSDTNGTFTQTMKSGGYMSIIPRDPKYTSGGEYTYKYIATTTEAYILCAKTEAGAGYICTDQTSGGGITQVAEPPVDFGGWGGGGFTCGVSTVAGAGGIDYGTVVGPDGKCWLAWNLGATHVAANNSDAYGYYYQWGRPTDGHQVSNSGTTSANAASDIPGHANFITEADSPYDWRVPQSPNQATLWAGANGGSNNPCPTGWHVPTQPEWATVAGYFSPQTSVGAFNSTLKLPLAGYRHRIDAALYYFRDRNGYYWSGSPRGTDASDLFFGSSGVAPEDKCSRALGFSVRCVKD